MRIPERLAEFFRHGLETELAPGSSGRALAGCVVALVGMLASQDVAQAEAMGGRRATPIGCSPRQEACAVAWDGRSFRHVSLQSLSEGRLPPEYQLLVRQGRKTGFRRLADIQNPTDLAASGNLAMTRPDGRLEIASWRAPTSEDSQMARARQALIQSMEPAETHGEEASHLLSHR